MICVKHSIITIGAYAGFLRGGGPTLKCFGLRVGMSRAIAMGVWRHAPTRKFFKNGAISCVLRAIFNHFHD